VINLLVRKFDHQEVKIKVGNFSHILLSKIIEKLLSNQWRFLN